MSKRLTTADYQRAATALGVDVAAVRAVTTVEARGRGFLDSGEPVILFERHVFHRLTSGFYSAKHPDVSNAKPGGYGPESQQHARLQKAAALDRNAALMSASWGLFQIMGFNHAAAGHPTLQGFINAMYRDEGAHLDAFVAFVRTQPLMHRALVARDWAGFARRYNGPDYQANAYDTRLAAAYARAKGEASHA